LDPQSPIEDESSFADRPQGLPSATLAGYQIRDELGSGDGSQIFLAAGADPSSPVVIKLFSASTAGDKRIIERLRQSLRVLTQMDQPGIPPILAAGLTEGRPYIVMPYYSAGSLRDRLAMGLLGLADLQDLLNRLIPILTCAHSHGVVHGHLKPSEVLFDDDGHLHLIGLGQTLHQPIERSVVTPSAQDTYMAPEITQGQPPTPSSDQYSLAVIALELATGLDPQDILHSIHSIDGERLNHAARQDEARLNLPSRAIQVFRRATAEEPSERFRSVADMQAALVAGLHDTPVPAAAPAVATLASQPKRRKSRAVLPLVAGACTVVLCLVTAMPALSSSNLTDFDLGRYAGVLIDALSMKGDGPGVPNFSATPTLHVSDSDDVGPPTAATALPGGGDEGGGLPSTGPSPLPADGEVVPIEPTQPANPKADTSPGGPTPTDEPGPMTPTPPASTPTPQPTNTSAPTSVSTATPVTPVATEIPPTDPGGEPTINPNKCKNDPGHKNYCTPVP
jgi:serine/threonine protein kinase